MTILRISIALSIITYIFLFCSKDISLIFNDNIYKFSIYEVLAFFGIIYFFFEFSIFVDNYIYQHFKKNRILNYLKNIFEAIILKDKLFAEKYLRKIEKISGKENDIVIWINGYLKYYFGNIYQSKTYFYKLSNKEFDILGGYTLFQIAKFENDDKLALEVLTNLAAQNKHTPPYLIRELAILQILNSNFDLAIENLKNTKYNRLLAISYFLKDRESITSLEKAYSICNEIPAITIAYAKKYFDINDDPSKARKIIKRTWEKIQVPELFHTYLTFCTDNKQLKDLLDNSFISNKEFGSVAMNQDLYGVAYEYLLKAFKVIKEKEIYDKLKILNSKDPDLAIPEANSIINGFCWTCNKCHKKSFYWQAICSLCSSIDSYEWRIDYSLSEEDILYLK